MGDRKSVHHFGDFRKLRNAAAEKYQIAPDKSAAADDVPDDEVDPADDDAGLGFAEYGLAGDVDVEGLPNVLNR